MGLQYFEALSPATISSIVAVLANRLVTGNDVTGYFRYPWLDATLPSSIFTYAIVYGIYGCCVGTLYVYLAKICKSLVHSGFHDVVATSMDKVRIPHPSDDRRISLHNTEESTPLVPSKSTNDDVRMPSLWNRAHFMMHKCLEQKSIRAALTGAVAGGLCGAIGIFLPHTLFWGESQLQNLIDKGRTPLPVFGAMSDLAVHARCMIDPAVHAGFSIQCSAVIAVAKTIAVGLSLGTGIIGGQFWGPLFVGCAASHLFTDMVDLFHAHFGFGRGLASYPCVVILCTMAAAHVGKCCLLRCDDCLQDP